MSEQTNDVVIGAGVLGRTIARMLRAQGRRVTVLNRSDRPLIEAMPYAATTVKGKVRAGAAVRLMDLRGSAAQSAVMLRKAKMTIAIQHPCRAAASRNQATYAACSFCPCSG